MFGQWNHYPSGCGDTPWKESLPYFHLLSPPFTFSNQSQTLSDRSSPSLSAPGLYVVEVLLVHRPHRVPIPGVRRTQPAKRSPGAAVDLSARATERSGRMRRSQR